MISTEMRGRSREEREGPGGEVLRRLLYMCRHPCHSDRDGHNRADSEKAAIASREPATDRATRTRYLHVFGLWHCGDVKVLQCFSVHIFMPGLECPTHTSGPSSLLEP